MPAGRMISWSALASIRVCRVLHDRADRPRITAGARDGVAGIGRGRVRGVRACGRRVACDPATGTLQAGGECSKAREARVKLASTRRRYAVARPSVHDGCRDGRSRPDLPPYTARLVTRRPRLGCLFEIVETLVLTLIIFFVIQTFVAQPYKVQQQSMEHTLEPDQYVLVDKLTPRFDDYKRGDIVVFKPPADCGPGDGTPFIKRVIGLRRRHGRDPTTASSTSTASQIDEPYLYENDERRRRSRPTVRRPVDLGRPRGRALPDGRPPRELRGLAGLRPGPDRRTSSAGPGCATGRSPRFGILQTPTYPSCSSRPAP